MALTLQIHPAEDVLTMYGHPDPSSAYSLSGYISISVTSPFSWFESRKPARLLLQSVTITFEGQSEIITPIAGYFGLRLCTVTRELAPKTPLEITNEGHEGSNKPCIWSVVFNLPIPGWLPPTNSIGTESVGTSYSLYATAKYLVVEEERTSSPWSFLSLCAPFRHRVRTAVAQQPITIARFFAVSSPDTPEPLFLNYLVNSTSTAAFKPTLRPRIPLDVLAKVQVLASVPEYIDMDKSTLPFTLRLRSKDLCEEECKKLQITEVAVDIIQREKCRYRPSSEFLARFPIPPTKMQPPNVALRDPHPLSSIYDVAMFVPPDYSESLARSFSLLPPNESGVHTLSGENYVFENDAVLRPDSTPLTWYTMDTTIPFVQRTGGIETWGKYDSEEVEQNGLQWAGPKDLRATTNSPLYSSSHDLSVSLTCSYDLDGKGGQTAREKLSFRVPITFGRVEPRIAETTTSGRELSVSLPIYSQLYDANGDRKIDYLTPLPLYTPRLGNESSYGSPSNYQMPINEITSPSVNAYHGVDNLVDKSHTQMVVEGAHLEPTTSTNLSQSL